MNSPIEIVQPSGPFSPDSSRCSISMGKSGKMISEIKKGTRTKLSWISTPQIFSKFEHSPIQIDESETNDQILRNMRNSDERRFKIVSKNGLFSAPIFFFVGEERVQERKWKKRDCCELANLDENSAFRQNYASFETWLRHRNRALNAPSSNKLEISSLTPGAACREAQSFFQTAAQRSAQMALRSCEWRLICIEFRVWGRGCVKRVRCPLRENEGTPFRKINGDVRERLANNPRWLGVARVTSCNNNQRGISAD